MLASPGDPVQSLQTEKKGINMLNAFYHTQDSQVDQPLRIPVGFQLILKTVLFCVLKTQKEKRTSPVSKNELMRAMIAQVVLQNIVYDNWV